MAHATDVHRTAHDIVIKYPLHMLPRLTRRRSDAEMTERIRRGEEWVPRLKFQDAIKMEVRQRGRINGSRYVGAEGGKWTSFHG